MNKLKKIIKNVPNKAGVYLFKEKNQIIYIGKAKNLKKRIANYFQKIDKLNIKTRKMVEHADDLEYIVVDSDLEAIILETNLIKEKKPKYNILMKDDKNFVYIKITIKEDYPRIYLTRKMIKDGSIYFGPKTSSSNVKKTLKLINSLFPFRNCRLNIETLKDGMVKKKNGQHKTYPCLFYQMDKGHNPCISLLPSQEYKKLINKIINFLKGKHTELLENLKSDMLEAAQNKKFEKAANLRDKLKSIENVLEKQKISSTNTQDIDVIDIIAAQRKYFAVIFQVREGKIINQEKFIFKHQYSDEESEIFSKFIQQYYSKAGLIPKEILIPEEIKEQDLIEEFLSNLKGSKVKINIPKIGRKNKLIKLVNKNTLSYIQQMKVKWMSEEARNPNKTLDKLKDILKLEKKPKRIECYDISHLSGTNTVASMVVFENGIPKKSDYRSFNIKSLKKGDINDFASLQETLTRRLKYLSKIPKKLSFRKQKGIFILKNSKKEILLSIKIKEEKNKTFVFEEMKIKKKNTYLSICIKEVIQRLKAKKYFINPQNKEESNLLKSLGFIDIDHPKFKMAYYSQKQIKDPSFNAKPDLIVIDGGKGQLSSSLKVKKKLEINIPFISLAKKHEIIYLEDKTEILLPDNSPERFLIQNLRDEAHRFAITKNRQKRIKAIKKPS